MRAAEISVGSVVWTKVSGERRRVVVVRDDGSRGRRYLVADAASGDPLPRKRSGQALHVCGHRGAYWSGAGEAMANETTCGDCDTMHTESFRSAFSGARWRSMDAGRRVAISGRVLQALRDSTTAGEFCDAVWAIPAPLG